MVVSLQLCSRTDYCTARDSTKCSNQNRRDRENLKFLQDNILNHDASYAIAVECTCVMDDGYIPRLEGS